MAKRRLVYIISLVQKSLYFEWAAAGLKDKYELSFILLNPGASPLEDNLIQQGIPVRRIQYRGKRDLFVAFLKILFLLLFHRPRIVHVHLLDAQLIGLTSAWLARVKARIYTRHTSNYHHVYHPSGMKYDLWSNWLATQIVSISQATDETLLRLEHVPERKVYKIPHGADLESFMNVPPDRVAKVRSWWGIAEGGHPVVGVVARHIEWKGIQYIIPAFGRFLKRTPNAFMVLANANGPDAASISSLLNTIPSDRYVLIPFEEDIQALFKTFDIYVHVPVDSICEAFGQTYVEALAAGIPSIFTLSGIAKEFIVHKRNAWVAGYRSQDDIFEGLEALNEDVTLREKLVQNGRLAVSSQFEIKENIKKLEQLYER